MRKIKITQWAQVNILYLPLYVAQEQGFFREHGLSAEISLAGNDDDIYRCLAFGEADFAVGDPTFCAMKDNVWCPTSVIGTISDRVSFFGVSINPLIKKISSVKDLVGLKVGVFPRPSTAYSVIKALKEQNKRLLKNLIIIEAPIGKQIKLLKQGDCDLIIDIEPFISLYQSEKIKIIADFSKIFDEFSFTGIYCKDETILHSFELCKAVAQSINKAIAFINMKDSIKKLLPKLKKLFPNLEEKIIISSFNRIKSTKAWGKSSYTSPESWQNAVELRKSIGDKFIRNPYSIVNNELL